LPALLIVYLSKSVMGGTSVLSCLGSKVSCKLWQLRSGQLAVALGLDLDDTSDMQ
jgi:hypothetical protein